MIEFEKRIRKLAEDMGWEQEQTAFLAGALSIGEIKDAEDLRLAQLKDQYIDFLYKRISKAEKAFNRIATAEVTLEEMEHCREIAINMLKILRGQA